MATTFRKQHHVRISDESHRTLQAMAANSGLSMTAILDRAINQYRREQIFTQAARAWATLEDELIRENAELEGTIADGLEHEPW